MAKFVMKPVVVDAIKWDATFESAEAIGNMCGKDVKFSGAGGIYVTTRDGTEHARQGDWIVRGRRGDLSVCVPALFEAFYEPMEKEG